MSKKSSELEKHSKCYSSELKMREEGEQNWDPDNLSSQRININCLFTCKSSRGSEDENA